MPPARPAAADAPPARPHPPEGGGFGGARAVAFSALRAVLGGRDRAEETLDRLGTAAGLEARDRALARRLVATTLRRLGQIDALIDRCLSRPLPASAEPVRFVLRLGVCQILFLDVPDHAAVDTSVAAARAGGGERFAGLVNAVLRRLAREGPPALAAHDAARLNTPEWLWRRWQAAYGEATCRAIADQHLAEPPLDLRVKADAALWAARLGGSVLPTGSVRLWPRGPVSELAGYAEGAWWVQDAAAALPVLLFGDLAGQTAVDLCAAPGGKTAQLAVSGARVIAVDRSPERIGRLKQNLDRLGLGAETAVADALHWRPQEPAHAVLLDAPCTGTGTIRRHPEIARVRTERDIVRLIAVQDSLLDAAAALVRAGGTLVYSVCSLEPEEGPERIARLLARRPEFRRRPALPAEVGGLAELVTPEGDLRTLPCHLGPSGGMDGFYAARLVRA